MRNGIIEIVGIFLVVIGCGTIVGAASLVSTALAVLAAGVFVLFGGILTICLANAAAAQAGTGPGERS